MTRLRCGLLGLEDEGRVLLEALTAHPAFELVALGDPTHRALRETAEALRVPAFQDCRSLLVETTPRAVLIALPPDAAAEPLRICAERGIAVLQTAPWTVNFETAAAVVQSFERAGGLHAVGLPWRCEPAYEPLRDLNAALGRVYAMSVDAGGSLAGRDGWRGDAQRAGGGTLLQDAYEPVDLLVAACGLPNQVHATTGCAAGPADARPYDTEDAIALVGTYAQQRCATVQSCRAAAERGWTVVLRGAQASAEVTPHRLRLTGPAGERLTEKRVRQRQRYAPVLAAFAGALIQGVGNAALASRSHLPTMALMQAAYLSAKTGQPESPARFLALAGQPEWPRL